MFCCKNPEKENHIKLIKVKEIELNPHELVFGNPSIVQLIESDSGKYLFLYNHLVKKFQFLDFSNGDLVREVPLDFDGPHGVGGLSGGTLTGKDSIWITFSSPAIGLINFDGKVLLKKKVENTTIPITFLTSDLQRPLIQSKHKIFGLQPYFMNHHGMDPKDIEKHQLLYSYDFIKDEIDWYDVFYPDDYWRNGKKMSDLTWTQRGNKLYLASIFDHQIQVFDISSRKVIETKEVRSRYIRRFDCVNEIPSGVNQGLINRLTFDKYAVLIYDPFRDVFYRFFHPGFELDDEESVEVLRTLNWSRPTMGVMILDKDLNILGEHLFEKNEVYTFSNYFIGEDGLYLSANNHFERDYTDDVFRYVLFNLVDDEQIN
ncbi:DUF4221 family protein [Pararhodonellum marinum]|uniref:DUF4221 family protein n=1 Tax=Pararhodonellum marinum TaxID=2755358 RepID=UPI001E61D2C7|nr:DUF4221 family protein [Pararhodonellum marinum]